jgi:hypothetical protein
LAREILSKASLLHVDVLSRDFMGCGMILGATRIGDVIVQVDLSSASEPSSNSHVTTATRAPTAIAGASP